MARTKLSITTVRSSVKRSRAVAVKEKYDDLDDLLDAMKTTVYSAAGAIAPTDGFAILEANSVGQAMTLAVGTVTGQTLHMILRKRAGSGTCVVTATYTGGTTLTFDAVGERVTLVWTGAAWTPRAGVTATLA